jgi:hypothetical protein
MVPGRRTVRRLLLRHLGGTIHQTLTAARSFIGFGSSELLPVKYFDKQNAYGEGFPAVASGLAGTFSVSASAQKQFPIMDKLANRVIQKYQQSSCEQLGASGGTPLPQM